MKPSGGDGLTAVDLFCGAGGFTRGLLAAGLEVVLGVDNWERASDVYSANFDHPFLGTDVETLTGEDVLSAAEVDTVHLVVGGPPCQGFSVQRIGDDSDPRNNLVLEFGRLAVELRPEFVVMENVVGLTGRRGQSLLSSLLRILEDGGYTIDVVTVDAANFGVPQRRRRVLVLGRRAGAPRPCLSPESGGPPTVWDAIGDLQEPPADPRKDHGDPLHRGSRLSELNRLRLSHVPPGGGFQDIPMELRAPCHRRGAGKIGHRQVYGRMHPDEPAPTITARFDSFTRGQFAHPFSDRNITLREGARLQGFPDDHKFVGTREEVAALIGNALPPPLARAIGEAIRGAAQATQALAEERSA